MIKVRSANAIYVAGEGTVYVVETNENINVGDKIMLNDVEVEVKALKASIYNTRKGLIVK